MTPDQGGRSPSPQGSSPTHAYTTRHPRDAFISFRAFTTRKKGERESEKIRGKRETTTPWTRSEERNSPSRLRVLAWRSGEKKARMRRRQNAEKKERNPIVWGVNECQIWISGFLRNWI